MFLCWSPFWRERGWMFRKRLHPALRMDVQRAGRKRLHPAPPTCHARLLSRSRSLVNKERGRSETRCSSVVQTPFNPPHKGVQRSHPLTPRWGPLHPYLFPSCLRHLRRLSVRVISGPDCYWNPGSAVGTSSQQEASARAAPPSPRKAGLFLQAS